MRENRNSRWPVVVGLLALLTALLSAVTPLPGSASRASADASTGSAGLFVPAVGRLMDTRTGAGGYTTPMPAGIVRSITAAGVAGIPATDVSSLALTLTVLSATTIGAVSIAPGDVATPTGASLVFNPGDTVSNTAMVALHADGKLNVVADHAVTLVIDVQGYFTAGSSTAPGGFVAVPQTRVADTRTGLGVAQAKVATGGSVDIQATGVAGIPADASGLYVNVAVIDQASGGYFRTYATGSAPPPDVAHNFDDTSTAQAQSVPLSAGGSFTFLLVAGGPVDFVVDIEGYFSAGATAGSFTPSAVHLLDTRAAPTQTLAPNSVSTFTIAGVAGIPSMQDGVGAIALNMRTVQASTTTPATGNLRAWPSDQVEPSTSVLNYTSQNIYRTNLVIVQPGADGAIKIRNIGPGSTNLVLDVEGWYTNPGPSMPYVDSATNPENGWTVPGSAISSFSVSPEDDGSQPVSYKYSVDGGASSSVAGTAPVISVPTPSPLGLHTLSVTAVDGAGFTSDSNDFVFNIGTPPSPPAGITVNLGSTSVDVRWTAGTEHGATTLGYELALTDQTGGGSSRSLGNCSTCTHAVVTSLDPTHSYLIAVTAVSAAGYSSPATTSTFTPNGTMMANCTAGDDTCALIDAARTSADTPLYLDSDLSGTGDGSTQPATADPAVENPDCNSDLSQRPDMWVCPVTDSSGGSTAPDMTPPPDGGGSGAFCNLVESCYYPYSSLKCYWHGKVAFGTKVEGLIGTAEADVTWQLVGSQTISKPVLLKVSTQTRNAHMSGDLFNGAAKASHGGSEIRGKLAFSPAVAVAGPSQSISWATGYKVSSSSTYDKNITMEWAWNVPGYEGYWYFYVRSPSAHSTVTGRRASYRFHGITALPGDAFGAGWRR